MRALGGIMGAPMPNENANVRDFHQLWCLAERS